MAQGGMLDEIFIKMGVKVDSKELEKLNKQFEKTVKSAANVAKNSKGGKSLDGLMKGLKQFNSLIPKGGGELGRFANGLSKVAGLAGGAAGAVGLAVAGVVALGGVVVATTVKLDKMVMSLAKANQFYLNFAQQTNTGIGTLNKYAGVAMLSNMNMSAEQVANSLQTIDSKLAEIRLTGQGAAEFQMLGISPWGKNSGDIIEDLRGKIAGLDNATASNLIQKMGLTPEWLGILRMSSDEFESLSKTAKEFQLSALDQKTINKYGLEFKKLSLQWQYFGNQILIKSMPALLKITKALSNFSIQLEHIVAAVWKLAQGKAIFEGLGEGIKPFAGFLREIWLILEDFAVWLLGGKSVIGLGFEGFKMLMSDLFKPLTNVNESASERNAQTFWSPDSTFIDKIGAAIEEAIIQAFNPKTLLRALGMGNPSAFDQSLIDHAINAGKGKSTGGASGLQNGYIDELPPLAEPTTNYNSGDTNNKISYNQTNYTTVQGGSREMANNANDLMFAFMQAQTVV